jgi:diacylglycerol O-acyltransferase
MTVPPPAAIPATPAELATLWVDDPHAAFNVALLCRFEAGPFRLPDGGLDAAAVRAEVARRARRVPVLRRRLTDDRRPVWIEDAAFRPEHHVECTELPAGHDLLDWCAHRIMEPLDRRAPLWRADVVPLPPGEFALLLVAHHVLADGRTGAALLRALSDPTTRPPGPPAHRATRPSLPASSRRSRWQQIGDALGDLRRRAPVTSLSGPVGPARRITVVSVDLADVQAAEATLCATVNDVLLAAVTAGLRELLSSRGERVDDLRPRASVPMSSGATGQPEGMLLVDLPVDEPDSIRRLAAITATTSTLKSRMRSGGGNVFDVLRLPTPLARAAVRGMRRIAGRAINLFVTNVPGPADPLRLGGARLLAAVPVAPLTGWVPLGIAALSYAGRLHVGINADAAITDLNVLTEAMDREFAVLGLAARRDMLRSAR